MGHHASLITGETLGVCETPRVWAPTLSTKSKIYTIYSVRRAENTAA